MVFQSQQLLKYLNMIQAIKKQSKERIQVKENKIIKINIRLSKLNFMIITLLILIELFIIHIKI